MDILILLSFYLLIFFSIIGFGNLTLIFFKNSNSLSDLGFRGILTLILISYITNFFFPHSYTHNVILLLIGLISFIFLILKTRFEKKIIYLSSIMIVILFVGLLMYKNHDDFFYYHFQYTVSLISSKKIIGLGLLEHGFRTPSSLFYLNSLFYLPLVDYYLLNLGAIFIMGFSNIFFFEKIFFYLDKKKTDFILFLSLVSLILINTAFYRIAEHGTDRSALILIFVFVVNYLESLKFRSNLSIVGFNKYFERMLILLTIIISLKSFYVIYIAVFIAWILNYKFIFKKISITKNIFKNYSTYFFILGLFIFTLTVFLNTGCLIYPASFTCLPGLEWGIPLEQVSQMKSWYSLWAKAGANPDYRVANPELYLSNFNWIENWFKTYFFTKVTDFLLVVLVITALCFFLLKKDGSKKIEKNQYKYIYFIIFLLTIEWFINHPALRYGGYSLISLLIFLPLCNYLSLNSTYSYVFKKKVFLLILFCFVIFTSKNFIRINQEMTKYGYDPLRNPYYNIINDGFYFEKKISEINKMVDKKDKKYYLILTQDLINQKN
tara:strand:- start:1037 stop:2686 length:1650 start_codon:yes stop_codon:yes gene_type:complete